MFNIFLLILLYLPFQLALNPVSGVDLASIRVLILALFFVWLAQGLKKKSIQLNNNLQTWLVASFLFLNLFSALVARNSDWSVRKLLFLFSIFPIYFVASQLISSRERLYKVVRVIVVSASGIAVIGIVQFLLQFAIGWKSTFAFWAKFVIMPFLGSSFGEAVLKNPSWLVNIGGQTYLRATSLFPDPHMLAFYLGLSLPLAFWLMLYTDKRKKLAMLGCCLILIADLLTFSRGGYIGLSFGLIFVGIFFWKKIEHKYKIVTAGVLLAGLLIMLVPSPISQRFVSSFDLQEGSNQGRLAMWEKATEVIAQHPLLGVGIGNYSLEVNPTATYRNSIYAHNTYLDIAVETGIVNMLVWLGILLVTGLGFLQKSKHENLFFFGAISLVIFSVHSLVETAIYSPVVLTLFLIIISFYNVETRHCLVSTGQAKQNEKIV
ncbi:MAG: O-antigen polymerase [Candidatus Moranbacteria bacterium GW2011_GWA2_39_41]|nr:MAG: O-antigen polymerase [Candidatus Moranbacteria bacterium GW2011_GWA2_39_41]